MPLKFPFRKERSSILGAIYRPVAQVFFWSKQTKDWSEVWMIVDSGADYSLLPRYMADELGVNLETDCRKFATYGIGGGEKVYFLPKIKVKLGDWKRIIPVGFLERDEIPPLLGRHSFMETFNTEFTKKHIVIFKD